jgi:hypothetical protein
MRVVILVVIAFAALVGGAASALGSTAVDDRAADGTFADRCGVRYSLAAPSGTAFVTRPPRGTFTLGSDHFVVHYPTEALASYAHDVIDAAELTFHVVVDTLFHMEPLPDDGAGGDNRVDIYLRSPLEIGGVYGTTVPDQWLHAPFLNSYTSWVELSDTLSLARRRVVTAHEIYHVVQVAYDREESINLLEMLSTWIEERVYDQYNLYYVFLLQFFRRPERGLFTQYYTNVPWMIFLTERYGDAFVSDMFYRFGQTPGPNPRGAFDGALQQMIGTNFVDEFIEFGTWNWYSGDRDDGAHYSEGADYPTLRVQHRGDCYPFATEKLVGEVAASYFFFDGDGHDGALRVRVEPEPEATSYLTIMRFHGNDLERTTTHYEAGAPPDSFVVDPWPECDSLLVIYQLDRGLAVDTVRVSARYEYDAPPSESWVLVFDRDGCRNPFDGADDEFTRRDGEEGPLVQTLRDAGRTVVVSDSLSELSGCSAVFVVGGYGDDGVTLSPFDMATLTSYANSGGDIYLESARLGAWVDSALTSGDPVLPAFWSLFGSEFVADSVDVTSWETTGDELSRVHAFAYDAGEPSRGAGVLLPKTSRALAFDKRARVRATVHRVGESVRVLNTLLLGGSTGRFGSTRTEFISDVLTLMESVDVPDPPGEPPPARLRLLATRPNPTRDVAELDIESPMAGDASVTVYDVAGRRVSTQTSHLSRGRNALRVAAPRASGLYFVVIEAAGTSTRGRFLVIR